VDDGYGPVGVEIGEVDDVWAPVEGTEWRSARCGTLGVSAGRGEEEKEDSGE